MTILDNPRAIRGGNQPPDYARDVTERMAADYAALAETVVLQLEEARQLPQTVDDEDALKRFSDIIVKLRDTAGRAEGARIAEKEMYLRGGQAVDGFFTTLKERVAKGVRALNGRVTDYQQRKLAEERAKRERERLEAERRERGARDKADAERKAAEDAERVAERARKNQEERREQAIDKAAVADAAQVDAMMAQDAADAARVAAAQKPAEMARSRFDDGGRLVTMRQVPVVEITDKMKLDALRLWPFIDDAAALKALRGWAKTNGHKQQMDGAVIGMRDEAIVR